MADDSYEWDPEYRPSFDDDDRYWAYHHARMRKWGEERRAREEAERNKPPQEPESEPEPKPSQASKFVRRVLIILTFIGGPTICTLILSGVIKDENAITMDLGQVMEGVGIGGIILTVVVILITAFVTFD